MTGNIMEEKKVRDIMSRGIITSKFNETLPNIAEIMAQENISTVVVVNQNDETVGIVSSLDIVKAFGEKTLAELRKTTAEEIMIPLVYDVNPEMTLKEVSNIMVIKHIHRVIVLSADGRRKPVGVLSAKDIVKEVRKIQ
jgi:CBS domain-containing protein